MADDTSRATHIAFVATHAFVDDVKRVFECASRGEMPPLSDILARWWAQRSARLNLALCPFSTSERAELDGSFSTEPDLRELLAQAPATVRLVALARLREVARFLGGLKQLNAPEAIIHHHRRRCVEELAALDPRAPWQDDRPPAFEAIAADDEEQVLRADLHLWLDSMLSAAQADSPNVGLDAAFHDTAEARRFFGRDARNRRPASAGWPGFEQCTMSVDADLDFWLSPRIALPNRFEVVTRTGARLVVTESSGPVTYAFAMDTLSAELDPELRTRVRELPAGHALISFVWLDNETAGPWQPY